MHTNIDGCDMRAVAGGCMSVGLNVDTIVKHSNSGALSSRPTARQSDIFKTGRLRHDVGRELATLSAEKKKLKHDDYKHILYIKHSIHIIMKLVER
jgi:hypothetical protein